MSSLAPLRLAAIVAAAAIALPAAAVELRGAGSTFVAPLIEAWADARAEAGVAVTYRSVGSGEGIRAFSADEVDFGATERPLRDAEIEAVAGGVRHVPITAGMVVVAYNLPGFEGELRLGREALVGIFSGAIRRWDDPAIVADNPGVALPDRDIALVARRDPSGTSFAFSNHLAAVDRPFAETGPGADQLPAWPNHAMTAYGNEGVSARIALSENSLGYVEYGFARRLGLKVALLENAAGAFVAPTAESGAAALAGALGAMPEDGRQTIPDPAGPDAYPVVTYAWALLRAESGDAALAAALREFFGFGIGEGQAIAAEIGYVPLPSPVAARAEAMLGGLR
jgi:phosphate transport system substrate-binding protein